MKWQPTPVFLPEKSHGRRSLVLYSPQGHKRGGHDLTTKQQLSLSFSPCVCVCVCVCVREREREREKIYVGVHISHFSDGIL